MSDITGRDHLIKICGVTTAHDAQAITDLGADCIGLILSTSIRQITVETARDIVRELQGRVATIAVVRNEPVGFVLDLVDTTHVDGVQVHGKLDDELQRGLIERGVTIVKALSLDSDEFLSFDDDLVDAVLIDGPTPGSGKPHPWHSLQARTFHAPVIAAGGLATDNVADVIAQVKPWGVDVATGVEAAPGIKDLARVRDFIHAATQAFGVGVK
ncbi:MAG: phosphoribosylanthranilate isomerase [Acidobacteria bacterium]|nr:phosphoribosylanthranilate isomerase [Acidobacteriota bacterium]